MLEIKKYRFYFCPCTQDLYGDEVLKPSRSCSSPIC